MIASSVILACVQTRRQVVVRPSRNIVRQRIILIIPGARSLDGEGSLGMKARWWIESRRQGTEEVARVSGRRRLVVDRGGNVSPREVSDDLPREEEPEGCTPQQWYKQLPGVPECFGYAWKGGRITTCHVGPGRG